MCAGFARTYYLKELYATPALPILLHIHGAVMTLWYVLFIVQVRLVAAHRVALHRLRCGTARGLPDLRMVHHEYHPKDPPMRSPLSRMPNDAPALACM